MKNISLLLLFFGSLVVKAQDTIPRQALMLKAGYGCTFVFDEKVLSTIKDNMSIGAEAIYKGKVGVSVNYNRPLLYGYFNLRELTVSAKYYPFKWYNQPFIGLSFATGSYKYAEGYSDAKFGNHDAIGICWGVNVKFPNNFYFVIEGNNVFNGYTGAFSNTTQTFYLNGMLGYRINLDSKKTE